MQTRRKVAKNGSGSLNANRRSSIICVKKSPIVRRYPRRQNSQKNGPQKKRPMVTPYESPLKHLLQNSPNTTPSTSKTQLKTEVTDASIIKQTNSHPKMQIYGSQNVSPKLEFPHAAQSTPDQVKREPSTILKKHNSGLSNAKGRKVTSSVTFAQANSSKRKKRNAQTAFRSTPMPKTKKKKLNKSPLSRLRDLDESLKNSNSIIVLEDSVLETPDVKPSQLIKSEPSKELGSSQNVEAIRSPKSERNSSPDLFDDSDVGKNISCQSDRNSVSAKSAVNNEEVIVIDCNNSTLNEMEDIHNKFHDTDSSTHADLNAMDSIIVIDPDEDPPVPKPIVMSKNEDCCVIWASSPAAGHTPASHSKGLLANSCASSSASRGRPNYNSYCNFPSYSSTREPCKLNPYRSFDPDLLKQDKILIDTTPDLGNLRSFNIENNRPLDRRNGASSRSYQRAPREVSKNFPMSRTCGVEKSSPSTAPQVSPKSTTTGTIKKAKNNEELIFLSESQCESDTDTKKSKSKKGRLREIVIDGNNVGMAYNNGKMFSEKGIKILIEYFTKRGHTIKVFIPQTKRSVRFPLLEKWHKDGIVVFTPGRKVGHKFITSYDDRYILEYATACGGIVVSQDQFRDLYAEKTRYKDTIENRLLIPTFAGEYVMFPDDPLGRNGPTLQEFLRH
ncbi:hypothetical protein QAD02_017091 [Eretmocerus hayati]|uniref:Uncharacterized protein n=1 Tax=Eretmocerus hayati TaxID=131215 RepID=A0ACC2PFE4_9HYME|nr:hypothetical protein QAD02_017091 [Eretmocerus hayati]